MKQSILILSNSDSGLCDFRKELLSELVSQGYRVLVSVPDTGYVERIRSLGCECIETALDRRGMNPVKDMKLLLFYLKLIRKYRPGAVLTYTIKPNIYGGLAARITGTPYLVNITGLGTTLEKEGPLQKMIVLMYRTALKKASCVFFQNRVNHDFMKEKGCVTGKTRIISGSGVNLQEHGYEAYPETGAEQKDAGGQIRFLSIMRLMKSKGIEELFAAAEAIHDQFPHVVFQLLGAYEEESRSQYEPVVKKLEKCGALEYYGYRDDVPDFLKNCHAVVHPSYHEGMSNVLLEAAATGRPVLASNVEGCRNTFQNGISGIAFEVKSADSLKEALERFLTFSHEQRSEMGKQGRKFVEANFDRRLVVKAYLEELQSVILK